MTWRSKDSGNGELFNALRVWQRMLRTPPWISLPYLWTESSEEEERTEGSEGETEKSTGRIIEFVVEELERMQSPVSLLQLWMSRPPRLSWDNWAKCARLCRHTQVGRSPSTTHWLPLTWRFVTNHHQTASACKHSEFEQDTKGPKLLRTVCKKHPPFQLFQEDNLLGF